MPIGQIRIPRAPQQGGGGFEVLPPGFYLGEVEAVEQKEYKGVATVSVTFRILTDLATGNDAKGKIWENLPIVSDSTDEEAIRKSAWKWERIVSKGFGQTKEALDKATDADGMLSYNPDKWVGKRVALKTSIFEGTRGPMASIDDIMTPDAGLKAAGRG